MMARGISAAKNAKVAKTKPSGIPWIGEVPVGWEVGHLKNCFAKTFSGVWGDESGRNEDTIVCYRIADFNFSKGIVSDEKLTKRSYHHSELDGKIVKKGDLLLEKSGGGDLNPVGRAVIVQYDMMATCSNFIQDLRCNEKHNELYVEYVLRALYFKGVNGLYYNQTIGIQNLQVGKYLSAVVPIPPLAEQKAIAAYLDEKCAAIDAAAAEAKKGIEEYKVWKKSLIFEAVTGKRRVGAFNAETQRGGGAEKMKPSGIPWIGDIPEGWRVMKLRRLGTFANGISKGGEFFGKGNPFVCYSDVYKNEALPTTVKGLLLSTLEEQERYSVKTGDVFFTRTSETIDEIGFAATCLKSITQATFAGFLIRFRPSGHEILPCFSKYYFRNKLVSEYFAKELVMVTRASLGQELLKSLPVLLPPLPEQQAIADYLDEKCAAIDAMVAEKEALIADLEAYKKSLIFEVVTGKREVA